MSVLIWAITLFVIAFLSHLLIWRFRRPRNPVRVLLLLFNIVILAGAVFLPRFVYLDLPQILHISVLFYSLFISYLLTYPAIEADSPSLVIVMRIYQAGKSGLSSEELEGAIGDELLVEPRIKDLVDAGLADFDGKIYRINSKGIIFVLPFVLYRDFLVLGKGG